MRYENEPCIGCAQALQPGTDDIIVCPDCGAPMHRHCWKENGACPYAARHGADFAWEETITPPEPESVPGEDGEQIGIICPNCGENCPAGTLRCDYCGADFEEFTNAVKLRFEQEQLRRERYMKENFPVYTVHGRNVTMGDTLAGQPVEEIALQLRGSHRTVSRYLERFEKEGRVGWNWAAFFLGPYWYFFRKLYRPAMLLAAGMLALILGFMPVSNALAKRALQGLDQTQAAKTEEARQAAVESYINDFNKTIYAYRLRISVCAAIFLAMRVAAGLLADSLLRRKLWQNMEYAREEGVTADGPGQRFGRHQLLIRLGGFSLFAPALCFWALRMLPGLMTEAIAWLANKF